MCEINASCGSAYKWQICSTKHTIKMTKSIIQKSTTNVKKKNWLNTQNK